MFDRATRGSRRLQEGAGKIRYDVRMQEERVQEGACKKFFDFVLPFLRANSFLLYLMFVVKIFK